MKGARKKIDRTAGYDFVCFKEKHGDNCFSFRDHTWPEICLAVARARDADDWYDNTPPEKPVPPPPVDPEASLDEQEARIHKLREHAREVRWYERAMIDYDLVFKARAGSAVAAQELIESRGDGEYEGFTFNTFTKIVNGKLE